MRIRPQSLQARVPVGESGTGSVPSVNLSNSLVRVYAFERQHVAGQRIRAQVALAAGDAGQAGEVRPRVRLHVTLGEGGKPVATGGRTSSELRSGDGSNRAEIREFASVRGARELFTAHPGVAYGDGQEGVPQFFLLDAFLGRTFIEQARKVIDGIAPTPGQLLAGVRQGAPNALRDTLERISRGLSGLDSAVSRLRQDATYRLGAASTSDRSDFTLKATATDGAGLPGAQLRILGLARAHEAASDPVGTPGDALALSGSFYLGEVKVAVTAEDDLYALARRINLGEDVNANGRLDGAEDRNFNLALDPYEDANGNGLLDTDETVPDQDFNLNGRTDGTEDLNLNFVLDGGTSAHGVEARVLTGRLILRRRDEGPDLLEVRDPDGILAALGLVRTTHDNETVFAHVLTLPSAASLTKDGHAVELPGNRASDLVEGVDLELRREGQPEVRVDIGRDDSATVAAVQGFVDQFNRTVRELNLALDDGAPGARTPDLQRFRQGLERASQDPLQGAPESGLSPEETRDEGFSELQVRGLLGRIRQGLAGVFDRAHSVPSAGSHLSQLGIVGKDDDTIFLDKGKLAAALASDPAAVRRLLSDPERGIATKVQQALRSAADPEGGSLPRLLRALESVNFRDTAEGIRRNREAQASGDALGGFLAVA